MSTSTLTVAVAILSGDNVQYQPLVSTFNKKTKIKKFDPNTFLDMTKQTILSCHRVKTRHAQIRMIPKHTVTEAFRGTEISQEKESQKRYVLRQLDLSENLTIAPLQRYSMLSAQ